MTCSTEQRLLKKTRKNKNGCLEFLAAKLHSGYGVMRNESMKMEVAHRISYRHFVGPIPEGLFVLHKCDNRICINPDHLFIGTKADNSRDMVNKGRSTKGERNPRAKLMEADVAKIKNLLKSGLLSHHEIASKFGVCRATISMIAIGRLWSD